MTSEFKSGFIAMVGRPNVGKSTLMNKITGEKISIISNKPQTTRNKILSILNEENYQIIFVDTPGVHRSKTKLGDYMNNVALGTIGEVDAAVLVVDAQKGFGIPEGKITDELKTKQIPTVLVINKIDLIKKEEILPLIAGMSDKMEFSAIIPISAKHNDGVETVKDEIMNFLIPGPAFYPQDAITDKTEREIAAEMIREKLLRLLDEEIPHGTAVEVFQMKEKNKIVSVSANIYCEKASHKSIIIGKGGAMLKKIGSYARQDLEEFLGKKVYLSLWVKVKDDWRNDNFTLKNFGFTDK